MPESRHAAAPRRREVSFRRILAPVDFSPASRNASNAAIRLAEQFGATVTFLHVIERALAGTAFGPPGPASEYANSERETAEDDFRRLFTELDVKRVGKFNAVVREGLPAYEIVEAAKAMDIDLIVMATHGYTGWKHFCIGSTAERVVRGAPCAVLVVREKEYEFS